MIEGALPPDRQRLAEDFKENVDSLFERHADFVDHFFEPPMERLALEGSIANVSTSFFMQRYPAEGTGIVSFYDTARPRDVTIVYPEQNGDIYIAHERFSRGSNNLPDDTNAESQALEPHVHPVTMGDLQIVLDEAQEATPAVPFEKLVERFVDRSLLASAAGTVEADDSREALTHFKGSVSEYLDRNASSVQHRPSHRIVQYALYDPNLNREFAVMVTETKPEDQPGLVVTYKDETESVELVYGTNPSNGDQFFGQGRTLYPDQSVIARPLGVLDARDVEYFLKNPKYT